MTYLNSNDDPKNPPLEIPAPNTNPEVFPAKSPEIYPQTSPEQPNVDPRG